MITVSKTITANECGEHHLNLEQFPAVTIYPSPNNGRFSIRMNTDLYTVAGLKVYNGLGQLVLSQSFSGTICNRSRNGITVTGFF